MTAFHVQTRPLAFNFGQNSPLKLSDQALAMAEEQKKSQWCWAAVLRLVLGAQPHPVILTQQKIAQLFFGKPRAPMDELDDRSAALIHLFAFFAQVGQLQRQLTSTNTTPFPIGATIVELSQGRAVPAQLTWTTMNRAHALALCGHLNNGVDWILVYNPANDHHPGNNLEWCPLAVLLDAYMEADQTGKFGRLTQVFL
jgi:hypothetical protein